MSEQVDLQVIKEENSEHQSADDNPTSIMLV